MAVTKILARKGRLDTGINYALNGDKTEERILTAQLNFDSGQECRQMLDTKRTVGHAPRQEKSEIYRDYGAIHYPYILSKIEQRQYPSKLNICPSSGRITERWIRRMHPPRHTSSGHFCMAS